MGKKIVRERNSNTKNEILEFLQIKKTALAHKDFQLFFENKIDRVTIYRALDRLVEEGKLHKVVTFDGVIQYALCNFCSHEKHMHLKENHDHVHFNCITCKKTTCLENYIPQVQLPKEYTVMEKQILVSGICPSCQLG